MLNSSNLKTQVNTRWYDLKRGKFWGSMCMTKKCKKPKYLVIFREFPRLRPLEESNWAMIIFRDILYFNHIATFLTVFLKLSHLNSFKLCTLLKFGEISKKLPQKWQFLGKIQHFPKFRFFGSKFWFCVWFHFRPELSIFKIN